MTSYKLFCLAYSILTVLCTGIVWSLTKTDPQVLFSSSYTIFGLVTTGICWAQYWLDSQVVPKAVKPKRLVFHRYEDNGLIYRLNISTSKNWWIMYNSKFKHLTLSFGWSAEPIF